MNSKQLLLRASIPIFLLFLSSTLFSQTKQITGKVKDIRGQGVIGASIVIKGTQSGTTSDADGNFSMSVPQTATALVISAVGFANQEVNIATSTTVDVTMAEATSNLDEVVVVGYGGVRRRDVTGSVASVQAKDFNTGQINSPEQLLQGKVAGLQITNSSGQPGGLTIVKIRGNNSIRTGNTPLYVVDGVPLDGRTPRPGFSSNSVGTSPPADPLTFINPYEIANVEVLKDASASAIYGSRGANGVILITTKKGGAGTAKVEANAAVGFGNVMREIDVLSAEGYRNAIDKYGAPNSDSGANVNAFDEITRTAFTQNYSLSLSGGGENGRYRGSFLVADQDGIILKTNLRKYIGNFNGQYKFLDNKLSIDFSVTAANVGELVAPISQDAGSNGNIISQALIWNPTLVLKRSNGIYNQENPSGQVNPLAFSDAYNDVINTTTLLGNVNAAYKILPFLEYRLLYGLNYGTSNRKAEIQGWIKGTGGDAQGAGAAAVLDQQLASHTITHTLNFNKDISDDFTLNAIVGYEYWKTNLKGTNSYVYGFDYNLQQDNRVPIHYYDNMSDGNRANLQGGSFREPVTEIQSYFGRAILNYNDRFIVTGTIRADGSNKFGSDNRYAYFPSFAAAWNIERESFMEGQKIFSALKFRAGYGWTGNQEFPADAALDVYRYNSYGSLSTLHFGNPALKWETVEAIDIGLDFTLANGKVYGAIDYYNKKTKDPIVLAPISQPTGAGGTQYVNLTDAFVRNSGVEISLGIDILKTKDWLLNVNGNVTFGKNIFNFPPAGTSPFLLTGGLHGQGTSGAFAQAIAHDQPINVFYLPIFEGFDHNGIGTYKNSGIPEYTGDPNPSSFMGFNATLGYKKWELSLGAHGAFGNDLYNNTAMSVLNIANINGGRNIASGLVTTDENPANPITTSTRYLESGSYVKLHNATIRFMPGNVGVFKNLTLYVAGNNLFVISNYKGFDPEVNVDKALNGIPSLGVDYIGYPTQRTFLFGVSFTL